MSAACLFAAIADDYTGGSDLAGMLHQGGVRTVQVFGLRDPAFFDRLRGCQAVVLSLKSRSIPAREACRQSVDALCRLQRIAPRQIQFKYCSTFDSTKAGNIGPVTDVLMEQLAADFTIAVPALPVNGRTQFLGNLFVGGVPLAESHMRHHPLNPMTDSNLVRHLAAQTARKVGLIGLSDVLGGAGQIRAAMARARAEGVEIALIDALRDTDLEAIADAAADLPLVTGGSGLGMHLPAVWRARGDLGGAARASAGPPESGPLLILSGSCSAATLRQLDRLRAAGCPVLQVDTESLDRNQLDRLAAAAASELRGRGLAAVSSSAPAEARSGGEQISIAIEQFFGALAGQLVREAGVRRLVVAGGETSGSVVASLDIPAVEITGILDPGVPSLLSLGTPALRLALKSGNFGGDDFFLKANQHL